MQRLVEFFAVPLSFPFMVRGLVAAALVGGLGAVMGTYVVLRGMAFFGDALAHAILPGVAVGYLATGGGRKSLFWWALGTAVLASLGIGAVARRGRLREDTAIGIVFAGMFALGIALISTVRGYAVDLAHFLFGNVLAVSPHDLVLIAAFGGAVLLVVVLFYKEFLVISFDPDLAATLRLPTSFLRHLLLVLIAVTVVVSLQAVGVALTLAMLVTPAATAYLLVKRFSHMMFLGAALGALAGVGGIYLSFWTGIASGAAIVLVATGLFLAALPLRACLRSHSPN
jgi:manganese/iron transport system permease protein